MQRAPPPQKAAQLTLYVHVCPVKAVKMLLQCLTQDYSDVFCSQLREIVDRLTETQIISLNPLGTVNRYKPLKNLITNSLTLFFPIQTKRQL